MLDSDIKMGIEELVAVPEVRQYVIIVDIHEVLFCSLGSSELLEIPIGHCFNLELVSVIQFLSKPAFLILSFYGLEIVTALFLEVADEVPVVVELPVRPQQLHFRPESLKAFYEVALEAENREQNE